MLKDFRDFLLRGNLIELAVALVLGAAFGAVITSLVDNLIMPIIAALGGEPNFNDLSFTINNAEFRYGAFITALVAFVLTAAAIYFFVVRPVLAIMERRKKGEEESEPDAQEALLADIKALLERQNAMLSEDR